MGWRCCLTRALVAFGGLGRRARRRRRRERRQPARRAEVRTRVSLASVCRRSPRLLTTSKGTARLARYVIDALDLGHNEKGISRVLASLAPRLLERSEADIVIAGTDEALAVLGPTTAQSFV